MSFKYSCIGDNIPENREWLEKVGYQKISEGKTECLQFLSCDKFDNTFFAFKNSKCGRKYIQILSDLDYINCIGNHQLFLAVTAMRDDSDYMQLFKCDGGYFISSYNDSNKHIQDYCKGWDLSNLKKMSLSELQEHFQRV